MWSMFRNMFPYSQIIKQYQCIIAPSYTSCFFSSTLLLIEFLFSFTHILRGIIYRENYTLIPWYLILCNNIVIFFKDICGSSREKAWCVLCWLSLSYGT
jgi:hypothetical protein